MHATVKSLVSQGVLTASFNAPRPFWAAVHAPPVHLSRPHRRFAASDAADDDPGRLAHSYSIAEGVSIAAPLQHVRSSPRGTSIDISTLEVSGG
jgi:hypothetical protein